MSHHSSSVRKARAPGQSRRNVARPNRAPPTPRAAAAAAKRLLDWEGPIAKQGMLGREAGSAGVGPVPPPQHAPGGELLLRFKHPAFRPQERLFTALPQQGMFRATPARPFQFTLGSFTVPKGTSYWMSDYEFGVLLFDGVAPGDYRVAEEGRFRGVMGFDLTVDGARDGDIAYQLDPVPIQATRQQFEQVVSPPDVPAPPGKFNRSAASSFANTAGQGTALLPAWRKGQGPEDQPWTWPCEEGSVVALKCVVFRAIQVPIAGIYGRIAGHEIYLNTARTLSARVRPR